MNIDKKVMAYYDISQFAYRNLYAVVLDYCFFDEKWDEIFAENLTKDDATFCIESAQNWEGAIPSIMSMSLIYRILYLREQRKLKRILNIIALRKIIKAGNTAKRIFRKHPEYINDVDKFLLNYNFINH